MLKKHHILSPAKLQIVRQLDEFRDTLPNPVSFGQCFLQETQLRKCLTLFQEGVVDQGDIVIDGGNAFYEDTQKRYKDI